MRKIKKNIIGAIIGAVAVCSIPRRSDGSSNINKGIMRYKLWAN